MATQDIDLGVVARGPQGPKGEQGNVGPAPMLKIGTVTKLNPDQTPTASLSGGNGSYTLNMGIPQGETNATATQALNVANSVNDRISAIQANGGGRNLLCASAFNSDTKTFNTYWGCGSNTTWAFSDDKPITSADSRSLQFTPKSNLWNTDNGISYTNPQVKAGEIYTFSFWGKSTSDGFKMTTEGKDPQFSTFVMSTSWQYYSGQLKFSTDNQNLYFHANGGNAGTVTIFHPVLEKGIVAHEWQPAPEDIQTQIDQARTDIQSTLTVANNGITAATNLKTTYDNYVQKNDANIKLLGDRITNEVSKITSNGGGTNILRNTDPTKIDNMESSSTWILGSGGNGQAKVITLPNVFIAKNGFEIYGNTSGNRDFTQRPVPWDNAEYVFSVYAKIADVSDRTSVDMMIRAWSNQAGRAVFEHHHTLTSKNWVRVTMSIDASSFYAQSGVSLAFGLAGIGSIDFAEPMLEKGVVVHDWQPAPEDMQSEIDANKTSANNAQNTANKALSKANSNATALNSKANKSDLTWANISGKPSIPSTFNGTISDTSTDFNNLISEGHYDIRISPSYQGKNGPDQGNWGLLDVKVAGRMIVQTYYSDYHNEVYVRNRHDGTWTAWRQGTFWS